MYFNVFKGHKKKKKKKKRVEQEEIFEDFLARSKFEQDFSCPKSTNKFIYQQRKC